MADQENFGQPKRTTRMNLERLEKLLAAGPLEGAERSPACPDEHQIAGYVDGTLDVAARERLEGHLADCDYCPSLIGMLCRERDAHRAGTAAPHETDREAEWKARRSQRPWWLAPQWAVAAALVLAVPLLFQLAREPERGLEGQGSPTPSPTRSVASVAPGLRVLFPGSGAAVDLRQLEVSWTEVPGTPYYDVRIVTDSGDIVIQRRVTATRWKPAAPLKLEPGEEYFVLVDAYPSGNKAVSSRHVPFRISD